MTTATLKIGTLISLAWQDDHRKTSGTSLTVLAHCTTSLSKTTIIAARQLQQQIAATLRHHFDHQLLSQEVLELQWLAQEIIQVLKADLLHQGYKLTCLELQEESLWQMVFVCV